jgi:tetratricopeptide (TPR) repeat protein
MAGIFPSSPEPYFIPVDYESSDTSGSSETHSNRDDAAHTIKARISGDILALREKVRTLTNPADILQTRVQILDSYLELCAIQRDEMTLNAAIEFGRTSQFDVAETPNVITVALACIAMAKLHAKRILYSENLEAFDDAIMYAEKAVSLVADEDSSAKPNCLSVLAALLLQRGNENKEMPPNRVMEQADRAIRILGEVITLPWTTSNNYETSFLLLTLQLHKLALTTSDISRLDHTLEFCKTLQDRNSALQSNVEWLRSNARLYTVRYSLSGSIQNLDEGLKILETAGRSLASSHVHKDALQSQLEEALVDRYLRTKTQKDLDRAMKALSEHSFAMSTRPERIHQFFQLGDILLEQLDPGEMDHGLEEVGKIVQWAHVHDYKDSEDDWINLKYRAALAFRVRGENRGCEDDLNKASEIFAWCLQSSPSAEAILYARQANDIADGLFTTFERTGHPADLSRGIDHAEKTLQLVSFAQMFASRIIPCLPWGLSLRFERMGDIADLDRAIEIAEAFEGQFERESTNNVPLRIYLTDLLRKRFKETYSMDDLIRAIYIARDDLRYQRSDHPLYNVLINNLSGLLYLRYARTHRREDLDEVISLIETTFKADSIPKDNAAWLEASITLSNCLVQRSEYTLSQDDIHASIARLDQCLGILTVGHRSRPICFFGLALNYKKLFRRCNELQYLDQAIKASAQAVMVCPDQSLDWPKFCLMAGQTLKLRWTNAGNEVDMENALVYFKNGWDSENGTAHFRLACALEAGRILGPHSSWSEASAILQNAVKLLPFLAPRFIKSSDKQFMLSGLTGLSTDAAAAALNAGHQPIEALQMIETGRTILAKSLLELRSTVSGLEALDPYLADRFISLRNELDLRIDDDLPHPTIRTEPVWKPAERNRRDIAHEFEAVVHRIREIPGYEDFLLPPSSTDMMAAGQKGPIVVINVSRFRSDAFIIETSRLYALQLPFAFEEAVTKELQFRVSGISYNILEWLWENVASPVLDSLGIQQTAADERYPHIWWIPTGPLSHFPIHAAGDYVKGSTKTVLDRTMSSYSLSVTTLILSRRQRSLETQRKSIAKSHVVEEAHQSNSPSAVVVAMVNTPGLGAGSDLPFARTEVETTKALMSLLCLQPIEPPRCYKNILQHLRSSTIFHFAGHGRSNPLNPAQSCLLLEDWQDQLLTVGDIRSSDFHQNHPFLAYLSACSTGENGYINLSDEGVHLISGFQLAGFQHVVGTIWEVSDKHCVTIAKVLYKTLLEKGMNDNAVYLGLHRGMKELRDHGFVEAMPPKNEAGSSAKEHRIHSVPEVSDRELSEFEDRIGADVYDRIRHASKWEDIDVMGERSERDVTLVRRSRSKQQDNRLHPRIWAPYVHFGI